MKNETTYYDVNTNRMCPKCGPHTVFKVKEINLGGKYVEFPAKIISNKKIYGQCDNCKSIFEKFVPAEMKISSMWFTIHNEFKVQENAPKEESNQFKLFEHDKTNRLSHKS